MHYGSYFFLALLCIFQPVISKGNTVDGREYRCDRSLRSLLSDKRSYLREDSSVRQFPSEVPLTRDDWRGRSSVRSRERMNIRILRDNIRTIRQLRTNEIRSRSISRNLERIVTDRPAKDRTLDEANRNMREDRATPLRAKNIVSSGERVDMQKAFEIKLSRTLRKTEPVRSRSSDNLRQSERRIAQDRYSLERNIVYPWDESERRHNVERRLSRNAYYRRQETRQRSNALPNRSRSHGRDLMRDNRFRNAESQVRRDITIQNRRNVNQRSDISVELRNDNLQKRDRIIFSRQDVRDHIERTIQRSYTQSRSVTRSNIRIDVPTNMQERNINLIREKIEIENQGQREPRSVTRREARGFSMEVRDMERDFAGRRYVRDNKVLDYGYVNHYEKQDMSGIRKSSRTLSQFNGREIQGIDRNHVSRSELRLLRESERTASGPERRNMLRESDEHSSRFDVSRNVLNSFKNEEKYVMINWQILFYTLQGIYLCSILVKALNKNDYSIKKTRSFGWFPLRATMKID